MKMEIKASKECEGNWRDEAIKLVNRAIVDVKYKKVIKAGIMNDETFGDESGIEWELEINDDEIITLNVKIEE